MGVHNFFAPVAVIGMVHVLGGVSVLAAHDADKVSGLSGPMLADANPFVVAATLLFVGATAIASRALKLEEPYRTWGVVPQQVYLMLQLLGVILAVVLGQYPDGFVPVPNNYWASAWFIVGDQAALIAICISHTVEMCHRHMNADLLYEELKQERKDRTEAEKRLSLMNDTVFWQTVKWENQENPQSSPCNGCTRIKMANMGIQYWGGYE